MSHSALNHIAPPFQVPTSTLYIATSKSALMQSPSHPLQSREAKLNCEGTSSAGYWKPEVVCHGCSQEGPEPRIGGNAVAVDHHL